MEETINWNDYTGTDESERPGLLAKDISEEELELLNEFKEVFIEQTQNFQHLGDDLVNNYQIYDYKIFYDFILYVDNNFIKINDIDIILNDIEITTRIGYFLYQILYFDFIYVYIPRFLQKEDKKTFEYIISLEYTDFRDKLLDVLLDKNTIINTGEKSTHMKDLEKLKLTIAMELFNNDLEDFCENFVYNVLGELSEFELGIL